MYEQIEIGTSQSLKIKKYLIPYIDIPYHHHPEIELVLVIKSSGKVFIRNSQVSFEPGDMFIFGSNAPHLILNDKEYYNKKLESELIVIQFHHELYKNHLLKIPEFINIQKLFEQSTAGIKFSNIFSTKLYHQIEQLIEYSGIERFTQVFSALDKLQNELQYQLIDKFAVAYSDIEAVERIQKINRFLLQNYNRDILLKEVAEIACLNKSSFCRYFKKHFRKTFTQYLNELRIDYASKLLIEGSFPISRIGYEAGYNNLPYFIRQFNKIVGMTPTQYRESNK